jgi:hypothetical protein
MRGFLSSRSLYHRGAVERGTRAARRAVVGLALGLLPVGERAGAEWSLMAGAGAARSLPTRLSIEQDGFPALDLSARYDNRPFDSPPQWVLRISRRAGGGAWELQHLHHKLYLGNRPPEVERFDITHGYNIVTLGHAWHRGPLGLRAGAGVVIAHPESTVRGLRFGPRQGILGLDQYLAGPALVLGASRELRLGRRGYLSPELQFTAAHARVPIQGGHASAPNLAVHVLVGLGLRF